MRFGGPGSGAVSVAQRLDAGDEARLVARARRDPEAFRELYRAYFPRVYAYVAYRVGTVHDAEDVVSETFLRAVEKLDRFEDRGDGSFGAWLFRIAHNLVSDYRRRQKRRGEPVPLEELPDLEDAGEGPEAAAERKEQFLRLRKMIETLSPRRQEVITLKFYGGLRNREIARVLGIDQRVVASHLCRGIEDLQRKHAPASDEANRKCGG